LISLYAGLIAARNDPLGLFSLLLEELASDAAGDAASGLGIECYQCPRYETIDGGWAR
jgi:hypothetical protein